MTDIVVGVDESTTAIAALRWAVEEGRLRGWPVTAVLAWSYLDQQYVEGGHGFQPDYGEHHATTALDGLIRRAIPTGGEGIKRHVVCDLPARALLEASDGAGLLVVGARGTGAFRGMLLGSVSQQCVHHATVPIAIIRADTATPPSQHRVVVGVDGSDDAQRALAWALDEARARDADVTAVHAWRSAPLATFEYAGPALSSQELAAAARETVQLALDQADTSGLRSPVDIVTVDGGAARAILDAAGDASLVVVGSRGRGGFTGLLLGSVSQHLVHHSPCPVVVVPGERPSTKER